MRKVSQLRKVSRARKAGRSTAEVWEGRVRAGGSAPIAPPSVV